MNFEKAMREYKRNMKKTEIDKNALEVAILKSKEGFWDSDALDYLSWPEFIYHQMYYIKKIWWLLQAAGLILLWVLLKTAGSESYNARCMGILAPLFIILVLPELWKNMTCGSIEIEGAALFSLHKVTAARMILFGMMDLMLVTVFVSVGIASTRITLLEMLIHFLLPMIVTICICLRFFSGRYARGLLPSIAACLLWLMLWILIVLRDDVYSRVSIPVWISLLIVALIYCGYCIYRIWHESSRILYYGLQEDR